MRLRKAVRSACYIENNEIVLLLQTKNIPIFNINTLTLHEDHSQK
jgi:hypothetical protein